MDKLIIDNECLENLRKGLEHGDISDIAYRLRLSRTTVSKVLRGKARNLKVIKETIRIVEANEKSYLFIKETLDKHR